VKFIYVRRSTGAVVRSFVCDEPFDDAVVTAVVVDTELLSNAIPSQVVDAVTDVSLDPVA